MVKALFDSSILIDYLRALPEARTELARYTDRAISIVSWMEVLIGSPPSEESSTRDFLAAFTLVEIDAAVAERAITLRRTYRLKLPDALVWASAQVHGMLLVTRDTKDFPANDPSVRHPYKIDVQS